MVIPEKNSMTPITTTKIKPLPAEYIVPGCFHQYEELIALQSARNGGVSEGAYFSLNLGRNTGDESEKVHENTLRLCAARGIDPGQLVSSVQVHGTAILTAEKPGHYHGYDALITDKENLFLCIFTADCYPVLIYDPQHKASGAVHAGWKGSAGDIVIKTIEAMQVRFNTLPEECFAYIGTGISPEAYEVGREVAMRFPSDCCRQSPLGQENEKYNLDLGMVNYRQLLASGIPASNIERSTFCSVRDSDLFFSYRRDQEKTGRMVSLIGIRSHDAG
jgi:YfiH family protein